MPFVDVETRSRVRKRAKARCGEIRVATGSDPVTGRTTYWSVTFTGGSVDAGRDAAELAAEFRARRSATKAAPLLTVRELLEIWIIADHPSKPSTVTTNDS